MKVDEMDVVLERVEKLSMRLAENENESVNGKIESFFYQNVASGERENDKLPCAHYPCPTLNLPQIRKGALVPFSSPRAPVRHAVPSRSQH